MLIEDKKWIRRFNQPENPMVATIEEMAASVTKSLLSLPTIFATVLFGHSMGGTGK